MPSGIGTIIRGDIRPTVPEFDEINAQQQQRIAIRGNTAALPDLEKLAAQINQFNWDQIDQGIESQVPNYKALMAKGGQQIEDFLSGEIPDDVRRQMERRVAEYSAGTGTGGSQFANFNSARTLGLTSLDLIQRGLASANQWLAGAQSRRPMYDVTNMFITPQQQIAHAVSERNSEFQRDWMQNQIDAQPGVFREAFGQLFDWIADTASSYLSYGGTNGTAGTQSKTYGATPSGGPAYGSVYQGAGGNAYMSVPTGEPGGGMSVPAF